MSVVSQREGRRNRQAFYRAASMLALPVAIIALIPSVVGLFIFGREIDQIKADRVQLAKTVKLVCRISTENRDSLRTTLRDAARRSATSSQRTAAEKQAAEIFYRNALARIPADPCKP